jgi:predicted nucleic acid-binding protein
MMLADSDMLIDFLRGKGDGADRIELELRTGQLHTTTVNAFELLSGAHTARDKTKVATLLAALKILSFDLQSAHHAAEIKRHLEHKGKGIGAADYLIAGACLSTGATLITRNLKHFERIPGLKISGKYD